MFSIYKKELHTYFNSLMAYVIIGFFVLFMGLWVWVLPNSNVLDSGYADLSPLFTIAPYIFMFLAPAITMGLLSEDYKLGTLELLLTSPLTLTQIIIGKYLAGLVLIVITLLLTGIYCISIYYLASPMGNIDVATCMGSYVGLFLLSAVFVAIGLCASACTQSQVVAFLVGTFGCFLIYQGFDAWATLQSWQHYSFFIARCGILAHYESLSRGVIDLRDVIYFGGLSWLLLLVTRLIVYASRK
jgi:ABC-2 type transport system permease protein